MAKRKGNAAYLKRLHRKAKQIRKGSNMKYSTALKKAAKKLKK